MVYRQVLAQRIRLEIDLLEKTVSVATRHWKEANRVTENQDAFFNSVALNLHSFYNGLERVLKLIAVEMDGGILGRESWHKELLRQMTSELPSVRPAVLTVEIGQQLGEYRKFRHRVRNIYATQLESDRMSYLVDNLPAIWQQIRTELLIFINFLQQMDN